MTFETMLQQTGMTFSTDADRANAERLFTQAQQAQAAGADATRVKAEYEKQLAEAAAYQAEMEAYANALEAEQSRITQEAAQYRNAMASFAGGQQPYGAPTAPPTLPPGTQRPMHPTQADLLARQQQQASYDQPLTKAEFFANANELLALQNQQSAVVAEHFRLFGTYPDAAKLAQLQEQSIKTQTPMTQLAQDAMGFAAKQQELAATAYNDAVLAKAQELMAQQASQNPAANIMPGFNPMPMAKELFQKPFGETSSFASIQTAPPDSLERQNRFAQAHAAAAKAGIHYTVDVPGLGMPT